MREIKTLFALGLAVLAVVGIMIIRYAEPTQTVDFRGEILSVVASDDGGATIYATSWDGGDFIFRIDGDTRLESCCGEITIEELTRGAKVDINYRKYLFRREDIHTVESLTRYD